MKLGNRAPLKRVKRHLVIVQHDNAFYKLFSVQFHKWSVFVHFPYGPDMPVLISRGTVLPHARTADFGEEARMSSHKVKYSHHLDGNCHFSQDSAIRTEVRNVSDRLDTDLGHMFSFDVQGLVQMPGATEKEIKDERNKVILTLDGPMPECLHLAAYWRPVPPGIEPEGILNPTVVRQGGLETVMMVLGPPPESPLATHIMLIDGQAIPRLNDSRFLVNFVGGFGADMEDPAKESSFLVMNMPIDEGAAISSVDYRREEAPSIEITGPETGRSGTSK